MNSARNLVALFALATLMGPGPGLYLVGLPGEDGQSLTFMGMPALYPWVVFWFLVQAGVILAASRKFWAHRDEPGQ